MIGSEIVSSKKILFVTDEMTLGGVSRVLNNLLEQLINQTDYQIDLLVLQDRKSVV